MAKEHRFSPPGAYFPEQSAQYDCNYALWVAGCRVPSAHLQGHKVCVSPQYLLIRAVHNDVQQENLTQTTQAHYHQLRFYPYLEPLSVQEAHRGYIFDAEVESGLHCCKSATAVFSAAPSTAIVFMNMLSRLQTVCNSLARMATSSFGIHYKARQPEYGNSGVKRFPVPDEKVLWSVDWPNYQPVDYTHQVVSAGPVWADPDIRYSHNT